MRLVLWFEDDVIQIALANRIVQEFNIVGIVKEKRESKRQITFSKIMAYLFERLFLIEHKLAWDRLKSYYKKKYSAFPSTNTIVVENINSDVVKEFTEDLNPDLILVSGTRLVRKNNLKTKSTFGIINLHTGLSPYIKGGPNCTNWCLAKKKYAYIGNTIMWIDSGIDSGNILLSNFVDFSHVTDFSSLHVQTMDQAHDLYLQALHCIKEDKVYNFPQSEISAGMTFYTKEWTLIHKYRAIRNFREFKNLLKTNAIQLERKTIKIVQ
jgi:methionyl-tRNA formyltransferase